MKKVFIHVGVGKTGSTAIQHFLGSSAGRLLELGYLYPESLGRGHANIVQVFRSDEQVLNSPSFKKQQTYKNPAELREATLKSFRDEMESCDAPNTIIVNETIYSLPVESFDRLVDFLRSFFDKIVLIMYLRRHEDLIISSYKQAVIHGATLKLEDFAERAIKDRNSNSQNFGFDFADFLDFVSQRYPDLELKASVYDKALIKETSLLDRFSNIVGLPNIDLDVSTSAVRNPSLDAACTEYLRSYNERLAGTLAPGVLVNSLKQISSQHDYNLTPQLRQKIFDRFCDGNLRLANTYLKDEGELLTNPPAVQDQIHTPESDYTDQSSVQFALVERLCSELNRQVEEKKNAWRRFSKVQEELRSLKQ